MKIIEQLFCKDVLVVQRSLLRTLGSDRALLLSLIVSEWIDSGYAEVFPLSVEELGKELCMGKKAQLVHLKFFKEIGVLDICYKGVPRSRYVCINPDKLMEILGVNQSVKNFTTSGVKNTPPVGSKIPHLWGKKYPTETTETLEQVIENEAVASVASAGEVAFRKTSDILYYNNILDNNIDNSNILDSNNNNINNNKSEVFKNSDKKKKNKKEDVLVSNDYFSNVSVKNLKFSVISKKISTNWIKIYYDTDRDKIVENLKDFGYKIEYVLLAMKFWDLFKYRFGDTYTLNNALLHKWVDSIRLLVERDGVSLKRLFALSCYVEINYTKNLADFWFENVMSVTAFRNITKRGDYYIDMMVKNMNDYYRKHEKDVMSTNDSWKMFCELCNLKND